MFRSVGAMPHAGVAERPGRIATFQVDVPPPPASGEPLAAVFEHVDRLLAEAAAVLELPTRRPDDTTWRR